MIPLVLKCLLQPKEVFTNARLYLIDFHIQVVSLLATIMSFPVDSEVLEED